MNSKDRRFTNDRGQHVLLKRRQPTQDRRIDADLKVSTTAPANATASTNINAPLTAECGCRSLRLAPMATGVNNPMHQGLANNAIQTAITRADAHRRQTAVANSKSARTPTNRAQIQM